jgi:hypothetical protein
MVGAPEGAIVTYSGNAESGWIIHLHGPSWDINEGGFAADLKVEYNADRYLLPTGRGGNYYMNNQGFLIHDEFKNQGLGAQIFSDEVQQLSQFPNIKYIETHAAGNGAGELGVKDLTSDNGYYTWPRFGYTGKIDDFSLERLAKDAANGDVPAAWAKYTSIQQLMRTPEGRAWWQAFGNELDLRFDLKPGSLSRRILNAYLKEKGLL